jgi:threonine dehydratase
VSCHPIAEAFNEDVIASSAADVEDKSIADAIVDHTAVRKPRLVPIIEETGGSGWVATNEDIRTAIELVRKNTKLSLTGNGVLPLVGLMHAIYTGKKWNGSVACIICGD